MSFVNLSPNMNLPIPAVGLEAGPQWATDNNNCLTLVDGHSHTPGSGVAITPAAMNINVDLSFNSESATFLYSSQYISQSASLSSSILRAVYFVGRELVVNDGAGNAVQITSNGSVVGTPGSITGLTPPASVSYAGSTFIFQSNANTAANIDGASYLFRNNTASSFALTLNPPLAMSTNYALTLPALPIATSFMTLDTSGNMAGAIAVSGGINTANIANSAITTAKIATGTILLTNLATSARESVLANGLSGSLTNGVLTNLIAPVVITNTSSSYNSSTGVYTVPTAGYLDAAVGIRAPASGSGVTEMTILIFQNGNAIESTTSMFPVSGAQAGALFTILGLTVAAGDTIQFKVRLDGDNGGITTGYISLTLR